MKISNNLKIAIGTVGIIVILATTWFSGTGCAFCILASDELTKGQKLAALITSTIDLYAYYLREREPLPRKTPLPVKHESIHFEERSPAQGGSMTGKRGC